MKFLKMVFSIALASGLTACGDPQGSTPEQLAEQPTFNEVAQQVNNSGKQLNAIADQIYERILKTDPSTRFQSELSVTAWRDNSLSAVEQAASFARDILAELDALPVEQLTHDQQLFAQMMRYQMEVQVESEHFYWYGFEVTPYQAGFVVPGMHRILASQPLENSEQRDIYLNLITDYERWLDDLTSRLVGQAERGIRLSKPAIAGVIETWQTYKEAAQVAVPVDSSRLQALGSVELENFQTDLTHRIANQLLPAFEALLAVFDETYLALAPEQVGQQIYSEGKAYYRHMVKLYGGPQYTPEQMHELGIKMMDELRAERAKVRFELGFDGSEAEFHEMLRSDSRFKANSTHLVSSMCWLAVFSLSRTGSLKKIPFPENLSRTFT